MHVSKNFMILFQNSTLITKNPFYFEKIFCFNNISLWFV